MAASTPSETPSNPDQRKYQIPWSVTAPISNRDKKIGSRNSRPSLEPSPPEDNQSEDLVKFDELTCEVRGLVIGPDGQPLPDKVSPLVQLPDDLDGYYFAVAANPKPYESLLITPILNGDGIIYRLSFKEECNQKVAKLTSEIAKPPCYYADFSLRKDAESKKQFCWLYSFQNGGPSRISPKLGGRNQLNTAFLQTRDHLLVTFDAGRPWIIDPESLEVIEPVGRTDEWIGIFPWLSSTYFPSHSTPAHPVCNLTEDSKEDIFFTLNYSTGYTGRLSEVVNWLLGIITYLIRWLNNKRQADEYFNDSINWKRFRGFTDLIRYKFTDKQFERWQLVLPDWEEDRPFQKIVIAEQAIHQMAITKDYILFMDIAFRIEFSQIFTAFILSLRSIGWGIAKFLSFLPLKNESEEIDKKTARMSRLNRWRLYLGYLIYSKYLQLIPPSQTTNLYIVKRSDLDRSSAKSTSKDQQEVEASKQRFKSIKVLKTTLPHEVSHFTVDYCNPHGKIILHAGHNTASDVTEWISRYDKPVPSRISGYEIQNINRLNGMITGTTDLGSLGRYEIDGKTGALLRSEILSDPDSTWFLSVYTHREVCRDRSTETDEITNIYWMAWGFSWELIPERIYQAYKNRPFRTIPYTELPQENKPCTLLRLNTSTMEIADKYPFPSGYFACTPQFIPISDLCPEGKDRATHGYIICVVLSDDLENNYKKSSSRNSNDSALRSKDEFWVFDANCLHKGPIARIIPKSEGKCANLGLTIHSTWLSQQDFACKSKNYCNKEQRNQKRRAEFYRDFGELLGDDESRDSAEQKDLPRKFSRNKKNRAIQKLFSKILNPFIEQKPDVAD